MRLKIVHGRVFAPENMGERAVLIENGRILDVAEHVGGFEDCETLDAMGMYVVPGFIDIHVHGGGGRCCMEGTPQSVLDMASAHAQYGTTTILPTAWTAPIAQIERTIDAVHEASEMSGPSTIAGIHLEGPFLSAEQAGAQAPEALKAPAEADWRNLLDRWKGIRMVGAAPELPGALELGDWLAGRGITASIAHSNAFEPEMRRAVEHGFSDVTHLYSGCSTFIRRNGFRVPGVVECALAWDELTVQVIADGCHLPDVMLQLIWRAKGTENMTLITDGLDCSGCELREGQSYIQQNGMEVVYEDGVMKLASRQAFAGSVATADRLLRTAARAGIPWTEALKMLTVNPAKRIGLQRAKGRLRAGYDADLVLLDDALQVAGCIARGKVNRWKGTD